MGESRSANKWWIALTVVPAGLIQAVDATSVSIAIPNMMTSLRADLDQIQWVVTISLVMQTLLMPTSGWLSNRFGRRPLFVGGLVFIIAVILVVLNPVIGLLVLSVVLPLIVVLFSPVAVICPDSSATICI